MILLQTFQCFYTYCTILKGIWAGIIAIIMGPAGALFLYIGEKSAILAEWQCLLLLDGVPALLAGFLVLLFLPSSPVQCHTFLNKSEHEWLMEQAEFAHAERAKRSSQLAKENMTGFNGVLAVFKDFRILVTVTILYCCINVFFGAVLFFPQILRGDGERKMWLISLLEAIPTTLSIGTNCYISYLSDKTGNRLLFVAGATVLLGLSMAMTAAVKDGPFMIVYFFYIMFQIAAILYYTMLKSYQTDVLPKNVSAGGFAAINGVASLGGVTGPLIMGTLRQRTGSFVPPLLVLSGIAFAATILSLLLYYFIERKEQRHLKEIAGTAKRNNSRNVSLVQNLT